MLNFIPNLHLWFAIICILSIQSKVLCKIYKVGDLDAWGIPTSSNPQIYNKWTNFHNLTVGDSLFFLYPPSQDTVVQVTGDAYNSCNLKNPILNMNNGNSLFNITHAGDFYFVSGVEGHCEKSQKLHVIVYGNGSYSDSSPALGPAAPGPSYPTVFGAIPFQASHSPLVKKNPILLYAVIGALIFCDFKWLDIKQIQIN